MAFVEDIDPFFADFAVSVTRNGSATVIGLFDKAYAEAFGLIAGNDPVFRCMTSVGMVRNDVLVIGGTTYTVIEIQPDGAGIDLCKLEAA